MTRSASGDPDAPGNAPRQKGLVSRRTALWGGGVLLAGPVAGMALHRLGSRVPSPTAPPSRLERWRSEGGPPYYIAHRGAGIVLPEHTLEGYEAALSWGAHCLEISVAKTHDDVLICMHDLTYDRTTDLTGVIADQPASVLDRGRVSIRRLGPRWQGDGRPRIPLLPDVLEKVGSRAVLCLEAKDDSAFEAMLALVRRNGLTDSTFVKLHLPATARLAQAHDAGFPVFMYAGGRDDLIESLLDATVASLDPHRDVLVLPAWNDGKAVATAVVERAVASGVPVWMYPVWRRRDAERLRALGVSGIVTPDIGYTTGSQPVRRRDDWAGKAMTSGQLTKSPYAAVGPLQWTEVDALTLDLPGKPAFVLLGQFCPIATPEQSYRLEVEARFDHLPTDRSQHISLAFGHADDSYYEHGAAETAGYHATLRADGRIGLFTHGIPRDDGHPIAPEVETQPLVAGQWAHLALEVSPSRITWTRAGFDSVQAEHDRWRGGYVHVGRSAEDGPISLRSLVVQAG